MLPVPIMLPHQVEGTTTLLTLHTLKFKVKWLLLLFNSGWSLWSRLLLAVIISINCFSLSTSTTTTSTACQATTSDSPFLLLLLLLFLFTTTSNWLLRCLLHNITIFICWLLSVACSITKLYFFWPSFFTFYFCRSTSVLLPAMLLMYSKSSGGK